MTHICISKLGGRQAIISTNAGISSIEIPHPPISGISWKITYQKLNLNLPRAKELITKLPGDRLDIKMLSYQYRDPRVKDKMVSPLSYLQHGNPHTWKDHLCTEMGPW